MHLVKALVELNSALEIQIPQDQSGVLGVEYGPYGDDGVTAANGTLVVEATIGRLRWSALKFNLSDDTTADTLTVPGFAWCDLAGPLFVRIRRSSATTAHGVEVHVNFVRP